jgi:hypothetical protein
MKKQGYKFGVEWIALNDETAETSPHEIASFISVALLADLFGHTTEKVANDVAKYRFRAYCEHQRANKQ